MNVRLNPLEVAPELMADWQRASYSVDASLEAGLVELRTSRINGCANCINLHAVNAREKGESEQRIYLLSAWHDAPCYSERERAALAWTEALTRLCDKHTHESAYELLKLHFTEEERVKLTLVIVIINGWNRIAVGCGGFVDPAIIKANAAARASAAAVQ
jgi:AhpD family alkylhydroperoxidase